MNGRIRLAKRRASEAFRVAKSLRFLPARIQQRASAADFWETKGEIVALGCEKSVQQKSSQKTAFLGRLCKERAELSYGDGDGFTFTFVSVLVSVFVSGAGVSCLLITVVLLSLFSAGGFTVVDFSSQAASKPRPSSRQIVFFITESCWLVLTV